MGLLNSIFGNNELNDKIQELENGIGIITHSRNAKSRIIKKANC